MKRTGVKPTGMRLLAVLLGTSLLATSAQAADLFAQSAVVDRTDFSIGQADTQFSATDATSSINASLYGLSGAASARSVADFTGISLHAQSSLSGVYTDATGRTPVAVSLAGLYGTFVVTSAGQSGVGYIDFSVLVDGTVSGSTTGGTVAGNAFGVLCPELITVSGCGAGSGALSTTLASADGPTASAPANGLANLGMLSFTYGTPFDLSLYLVENAFAFPTLGATASIDVDFANTAVLQPLRVFNAAGALDTGAIVQDASDPSFRLATAVPEPATWAQMLLGFLALGALLRNRRGRDHALVALGHGGGR